MSSPASSLPVKFDYSLEVMRLRDVYPLESHATHTVCHESS